MIIHDIKHPTESLINALNEIVNRVKLQVITMGKLQNSNKTHSKILRAIFKRNGFSPLDNSSRLRGKQ